MIPLIGAHDFPYIFPDQAADLFRLPLTWAAQSHDSLGIFTLSTLWNWPYGILYGLAGKVGLNFTLSTWILGIFPVFIFGWFAMGKLLKSYSLSFPARLVGQFLFIANTYILMLIDGGQLSLAVAYSLFPLVILYLPFRLSFVLTIVAISFLDIRYLYVLFIPIGLKVFFDFRHSFKYLVTGLLTGLVLLGLHSYWIVPSLFTKGPSLPSTYTRPTQVDALSFASLSHALFLIHPHWPKNIFGQIAVPSPLFVFLPVLAFLPLAVFRKNKIVSYWSTLAIISAFLVKGSGSPFPQTYGWLFSYVPGFSLFRDPTKFFPLLVLSYSVLIAFSADFIYSRKKSLYLLIPLYLVFLVSPILVGKATGLFSGARNQESYVKLASYLDEDNSSGSILWVPSKPPLGYSSPLHPSIDALTLLDKRPFATGVVGSYELLNFLREATYSGELLDIASVKYLAVSSIDPKRDSLKIEDVLYHNLFTKQIASQPWVKSQKEFGSVTLLETKNSQPIFFIPTVTTFVVGSDDIYNTRIKLKDNGLVFVESQPNLLSRIYQFPQAKIILNNKTSLDAAAALIPSENFVYPSQLLNFSPDSTGWPASNALRSNAGWWKRESTDLIDWREFLQQKYGIDNQDFDYGGGWAISEGSNKLSIRQAQDPEYIEGQISNDKFNGNKILLARVMTSSRSGEINFYQNNQKIGSVNTLGQQTKFDWREVGLLSGLSPIDISTEGDINVVNAIVAIPMASWEKLKSQAIQLQTLTPTSFGKIPKISYKKFDQTHYQIKVTDLDSPTTLAFVQNYDYFWELSGQKAVPLYSMINGFSIPGAGEYDLIFTPQEYVNYGLIISTVTLLVLLLFIYNVRRK